MLMSTRHITTVLMKTSAIQKTRDHSNPQMWLLVFNTVHFHLEFPMLYPSPAYAVPAVPFTTLAPHQVQPVQRLGYGSNPRWSGEGTGRHQKMDENGGFFKFTGVPNCQKSDLVDNGKVLFFWRVINFRGKSQEPFVQWIACHRSRHLIKTLAAIIGYHR